MPKYGEALNALLGLNKKAVAINTIIIANAFIWYSYGFNYLLTAIKSANFDILPIIEIHFLGLFLALILGQLFSGKIKNKLTFLQLWIFTGVFLSLLPLITGTNYIGILIFSIIVGANFGFGIPTCLSYFSFTTEPRNRGKLGGILFLVIGAGGFLISTIAIGSYIMVALILAIWRSTGLLFLLLLKPEKHLAPERQMHYKDILTNRSFLLYFIPWVMFLIVNSLSFPVIGNKFNADLVTFSGHLEFVLIGISGVFFGFLVDLKGRKRLVVIGAAMLGFGYAILAFTGNIYGWWIYTFIDGITWGIFVMLFIFTIWGDLAEGRNSEKIYAIGLMPYLFSTLIRYSLGPYLTNAFADSGFATIFSFFSFFLFIAVFPLVFAPETLPEQIIKDNDVQSYIKKAQKQVDKGRVKNSDKKYNQSSNKSKQEEQEEYEKARELAEKYYK